MAYQIVEKLLPKGGKAANSNRPGTPLSPEGVVVHETATPNATAENEYRYFSTGYRGASAHYFVDDKVILRVIPENEMAWHAGPTANKKFLSVELCHFKDETRFQETWKRAVWLVADMCRRYGWDPKKAVVSHAWVSRTWKETNHTDPEGYFAAHGRSMEQFVSEVVNLLKGGTEMPSVPAWKEQVVSDALKEGLITQYHNPNEPADKAFVLAVILNLLKRLEGRKS